MDRGAWWARVLGVAKSQTLLSNWTCTHTGSAGITNLVGMGVRLEGSESHLAVFSCVSPQLFRTLESQRGDLPHTQH